MIKQASRGFIYRCPMLNLSIVDREIFAVKIIRVLNFRVKNILSLDGSTM